MEDSQKRLILSKEFFSTNLFKIVVVIAIASAAIFFVFSNRASGGSGSKICVISEEVGNTYHNFCCTSVSNGWKPKEGLTEKAYGTCSDDLDNDCDGNADGDDSDC